MFFVPVVSPYTVLVMYNTEFDQGSKRIIHPVIKYDNNPLDQAQRVVLYM